MKITQNLNSDNNMSNGNCNLEVKQIFSKELEIIIAVCTIIIIVLIGSLTIKTALSTWTVDRNFDAMDKVINTKFDVINTKIDAIDTKFESKFDQINTALNKNMELINQKLDSQKK